jgi:DNA-binding MarR family transcriptional regulator
MSPPPPPSAVKPAVDRPDELADLLRETYLALKRRQREFLRELGLSFSEWSALHSCSLGPVRGGELADATGLTSAGVTDLVDRLEGRGLVRRLRDPDDRRAIRIELTDAGRRLTINNRRVGAALLRGLTAQLTPEERRSLTSGLRAFYRIAAADTPAPLLDA